MAMNSKVRFSVDDATAIRKTSAVVAAVANTPVVGSSVSLDLLSAYWEVAGDIANEEEIAIFGQVVEVLDDGGAIVVQAMSGATATVLASKAVTATGAFTFVIAREQLAGNDAIRIVTTVADADSAVEFWAYVAPLTK